MLNVQGFCESAWRRAGQVRECPHKKMRKAVSNLNTALVEVRTDDGDLVEAHGGYALRAITYDKDKQTYTVACTTAADDTTAQAISQLVSKVEELETSNTALAAQVDYISMMTDTEVA